MVHGNKPEEVLRDLEGTQTMRTLGLNMAWVLTSLFGIGERWRPYPSEVEVRPEIGPDSFEDRISPLPGL